MASNITPTNIDGTYPIAGIDNDSQQFRTNFTNTSTNFTAAKDEIEDLQAKSILKAPLDGETEVDNDLVGNQLKSAQLIDTRETVFAHGTDGSGSIDLLHTNGQYQTVTTSVPLELTLGDFPADTFGHIKIQVTIADAADTLTIPTGMLGTEYITGFVADVITFTGTFPQVVTFEISSDDATTYTIRDLTRSSARPNPTATTAELEDITDSVNTDAIKVAGYSVFNTDTGALAIAVGDTDGAVWNNAIGALAHTPV